MLYFITLLLGLFVINCGGHDRHSSSVILDPPVIPMTKIELLILQVQNLQAEGKLTEDDARGLITKLETANERFDMGKVKLGVRKMKAFTHQVCAFFQAGVLEEDEANLLNDLAHEIIEMEEED